uniref:Uncharacterized protein n=1 Tax=Romanomermis culicivorax TaxID=13658 RepID=A0A915IS43_ROMCU
MANGNKTHNFRIEARNTLEQLSTAAAQITNHVPTVKTIDQIIILISDQFQAQQLCIQREIQEQVQSINACFTTLAEQMQQLISTTTAAAVARNVPTPRPLPVTSQFHGEEMCDIYIPIETLCEIELTLALVRLPRHIKPKASSVDTLYNHKFSRTTCGKDEVSRTMPQRRPLPAVNPFGFWDYPLEDYFDHPQPQYDWPHTSHHQEYSRIKTIVDNMHPLAIDGSTSNKCLLHFFIRLKKELLPIT